MSSASNSWEYCNFGLSCRGVWVLSRNDGVSGCQGAVLLYDLQALCR